MPTYFTGVNMTENVGREGLAPCKISFLVRTVRPSKEKKDPKELKVPGPPVLESFAFSDDDLKTIYDERSVQPTSPETLIEWDEEHLCFIDDDWDEAKRSAGSYFLHDFHYYAKSPGSDYTRAFAFLILRPLVVEISDDLYIGDIPRMSLTWSPDLQFLGVDSFRNFVPVSDASFMKMSDLFEGDNHYHQGSYYRS